MGGRRGIPLGAFCFTAVALPRRPQGFNARERDGGGGKELLLPKSRRGTCAEWQQSVVGRRRPTTLCCHSAQVPRRDLGRRSSFPPPPSRSRALKPWGLLGSATAVKQNAPSGMPLRPPICQDRGATQHFVLCHCDHLLDRL